MTSPPKRELLKKTPLRPPQLHRTTSAYTQPRASADEVSVGKGKENGKGKQLPVVEFTSQEPPQPFLDPSIIQRRIQYAKQYEIDQRKQMEQQAPSSSG
ncbi:uncharacterized protein BP5553_08670 [Venustampulla echinocandica]|uniref:Uncharacterized protein n=1 Tax=Venustampulla echinocandica TaxID=2656787 RepID=A0A370TEX5_9HELO|nr:uncharacterized protein BP5553_08670 [Venustampulla echinocandica]RDL33231.1 hypothetical protein BP5553_08670 [Venustampulla echinocandica]